MYAGLQHTDSEFRMQKPLANRWFPSVLDRLGHVSFRKSPKVSHNFFVMDVRSELTMQQVHIPSTQARIARAAIYSFTEEGQSDTGARADSLDKEFEAF